MMTTKQQQQHKQHDNILPMLHIHICLQSTLHIDSMPT